MSQEFWERQQDELEALTAIYLDDFVDMRSAEMQEAQTSPEICLKLTPLQSIVGKDVHARIDLIVKFTTRYPLDPPIIDFANAKGLPDEKVLELKKELIEMADRLLGEVMVLELARYTQEYLHKYNVPQLSFYDQMISNRQQETERKRKEEESIKAKHLAEVNEEQNDVIRQVEEEMLMRNEMLKEAKRKRQRTITFNSTQSSQDENDNRSCQKDVDEKVVIVNFALKDGQRTVHVGKCCGHHYEGECIRTGFDINTGDVFSVLKWVHGSKTSGKKGSDAFHESMENIIKQVKSVEQELHYLIGKIDHTNLIRCYGYSASNDEGALTFWVLLEALPSGTLDQEVKGQGLPLETLRFIAKQLVDVMAFLHNKNILHRDFKLEYVYKQRGDVWKIGGYGPLRRLEALKMLQQQASGSYPDDASQKKLSRVGKKGDVFNFGIALLSLAEGKYCNTNPVTIPEGLHPDLGNFLDRCLDANEKERWSFIQLSRHPFMLLGPSAQNLGEQSQANDDPCKYENRDVENESVLLMRDLVPTGKSRLKSEFEVLQWLGQGGFGSVFKVRNKLDGKFYAIKKVALNPHSFQLNKRITREVKLLSRLNHEHVVRYCTAWVEREDVPAVSDSSSDASVSTSASPKSKKIEDKGKYVQGSDQSLLEINNFEAPACVTDLSSGKISWYVHSNGKKVSEESSSSSSSSDSMSCQQRPNSRIANASKFESSDGISFQVDESMFQFGDLLDSEESEDESVPTASERLSNDQSPAMQYLYIQMEYYEKSTLRNIIDEGLYEDSDRIWRLFREMIEGLVHVHSQGIIHRDLKPVNIFMDAFDHVKIGDFGLATSHASSKAEVTEATSPTDQSDDKMTGKVGTALYVAPELGTATSRVKFSQKVDIYSLGIIFFEMCTKPLTTGMERAKIIGAIRKSDIVLPEEFNQKGNSREKYLLKWLLQHSPDERPTAQKLLDSAYVPLKLEDRHLDEILRHTLNQSNSSLYQRLMSGLFHQKVKPAVEQIYDTDLHGKAEISIINDLRALNYVEQVVRTTFEKHGAIRVNTPLLLPKGQLFSEYDGCATVMDRCGVLLTLPFDSRVNFARYVARNEVQYMKRYVFGKVFRDPKLHRAHPREIRECSFDIVTGSENNCLPEAEVLFAVSEVIQQFPSLEKRNYYIRLSHASLLKAILMYLGIAEDQQNRIYRILEEAKDERNKRSILTEFLQDSEIPEHNFSKLFFFLEFEGSLSKAKESLQILKKCRGTIGTLAKQAFAEIELVVRHAKSFELQLQICVFPSLVYNIRQFSGIMYQFVAVNKRKLKHGGVDIFAAGGRYDKLIETFSLLGNTHASPRAVGISIAVEKIVSSCLENHETKDEPSLNYSECDVLVSGIGQTTSQSYLIALISRLWRKGIRSSLFYNGKDQDFSVEEIQNYCKQKGIHHLVIVKQDDNEPFKYKVREKDKFIEIKIPSQTINTVILQIQQRLSCKTEAKESDTVASEPEPGSLVTSNDNATPMVTFVTPEKLPNYIKRKHESHMMSKIAPMINQLCVKTQVEVMVVDLPLSTLRSIVAYLELDGNEEDFQTSLSYLIEVNHKVQKMYLQRICNTLRQIKMPKSQDKGERNLVVLYTYKGDNFKLFL